MTSALTKPKTLQANQTAPDFEEFDHEGKKISLSQFKGKTIVLFFYPKDDTPGCTKEACSLRDRYASFKKKRVVIIGVSKDSPNSHKKFIEKYDLPFILVSDGNKKILSKYGVFQEKIMYGKKVMGTVRTTFIITPEQKIAYIFNKIDCEHHAEEVLDKLEELKLI